MEIPTEMISKIFWVDQHGQIWKVPTIVGRLKCGKIPCHRALKEFVIWRAGGVCEICQSAPAEVADHVISRRNGGSHHPENLQAACVRCNSRKSRTIDAKGVR